MKILVTGANGLLGQKLTSLLDSDPHVKLIATTRKNLSVSLQQGTFMPLDVTDGLAVTSIIEEQEPDVIIHTAAMTQVDQCETERDSCWLNNVIAVNNLVQTCDQHEIRLIHISTDFIFDGTHGPLDETEKPNPLSYYGESKLAAELIVQTMTSPWVILRTVLVYGVTPDMSRSNIVLWVKKSLEDGKVINVVDDQWRTPTLAEDLAEGCALAAHKKATGIYNISGSEMVTPYDIAIRTARFFKLDETLIRKTDSKHFKQPAARPAKTGFIIEKAKKELGFSPHSFEEGLAIVSEQLMLH
jgi:dTDP-4-dehydrorhamnose reductase